MPILYHVIKCDFQCPGLPTYELCVIVLFRTCYTPQGYKTSAVADKPWSFRSSTVTPTSGSAQLSSSAPKSFSKTKSTWQQEENSPATSTTSTDSNSNKYVCLWKVYFMFTRRLMDYEIDAWHIWIFVLIIMCVLSGRWTWTVRTCSDSPGCVPLLGTCAHRADLTRAPLRMTWKSLSSWTTLQRHHHEMG